MHQGTTFRLEGWVLRNHKYGNMLRGAIGLGDKAIEDVEEEKNSVTTHPHETVGRTGH